MDAEQETSHPNARDGVEPRQRLLKGLVIFLAVLLVVGFAVVVATIVYRIGGADEKTEALRTEADTPMKVDLPEGARIVDILVYRGELALHVTYSDGRQAVLILDSETGGLVPLAEFQ